MLRLVLPHIAGIIHLRYHFEFARKGFDAYHYADTPCGKLVKPLVGDDGATKVVAAAHDEVGEGEVDGIDVPANNFPGVRGDFGESETDGQAGHEVFPHRDIRGHYNNDFIFFFYHIFLAYLNKNA